MEIISVGLLLLMAGLFWRRRTGTLKWRLSQARRSVEALAQKKRPDRKKAAVVFRQLYAIINQALETKEEDVIYQAADVLKLAAGSGLGQRDEPVRLMAVTVAAIKAKQPDTAGHLLDSFRPLVRRWEPEVLPAVLHPLLMVLAVAMKEKNNFLAARVVDLVFIVMDRPDCQLNKPAMNASFRALRTLGLLAIRYRDEALFQELATRLTAWTANSKTIEASSEAGNCLYAWLHRVIKNNDTTFLSVLEELAQTLTSGGIIRGQALQEFLDSWIQLAGNACLNPYSQVGPAVIARVIAIALATEDKLVFRRSVRRLVQVSAMALTRYTLAEAFLIVFPLAEAGRRLLQAELDFGPSDEREFRPQALQVVVGELLMAFEILARQRMTVVAGEIIAEFCELWKQHPATAGNYGKTAQKFCQLLLTFWMQNRKAKARRLELTGSEQFTGFSLTDRAKLGFMLDPIR